MVRTYACACPAWLQARGLPRWVLGVAIATTLAGVALVIGLLAAVGGHRALPPSPAPAPAPAPAPNPSRNEPLPWGPADCFVRPTWAPAEIQVLSDMVYGAAENPYTGQNETLLLDVYLPPASDRRESRPVAVLQHGGAFTKGSKTTDGVPVWAKIMAMRGFVVLSINYRLIPWSHILTLRDPDPVVAMAQEDALTAVRFLHEKAAEWRADVRRIVLGGDSAGAIAALWYGYMPQALAARPDSGSRNGPAFGINAVMSLSGAMKAEAFCAEIRDNLEPVGCLISSSTDHTSELSSGDIPLLMIHGTRDHVIPYVNAEAVARRANATGIRNLLITIPGAGHVPAAEAFNTSGEYLDQWLLFLTGALNLAAVPCPSRADAMIQL